MKITTVACIALLASSGAALAAEEAATNLEPVETSAEANNNIANIPSLQRGAKYFVNYCLGCHSAQYVRYNKLAEGLSLTDKQLADNLMFTGSRPFDTMTNAMQSEDAERWFGVAPPDLSLIARSKGVDYLYNYLRGFYADPTRPTGANNLVLPNSAMPDVLWELQGIRKPVYAEAAGQPASGSADDDGAAPQTGPIMGFEVVKPGLMTDEQFDQAVRDIVNFLDYIGEPMRGQREGLGIEVVGFLLVFLLIVYLLKKEIWKDVK